MAKVIVTGANGFLGSWLVKTLIDQGHQVTALVRKNSDLSELEGCHPNFVYGDVTDLKSLQVAFYDYECVFHLAGLIAYKKSERAKMDLINVQGTANVIQACSDQKIKRLVYLSSVVAVGAGFNEQQILNEDSDYNVHKLNLGYFETKHQAELLVKEACRLGKINAVILNPSTIYGAGDARKGSRKTQLKVAQGKFPFYTSGGVNVVAVEDVVAGIISAWHKGRKGERYILAGENLKIRELFKIIAEQALQKPPNILMPDFVLHTLGLLGDFLSQFGFSGGLSQENAYTATMFHWFDCSKAKKELDFNPRPAKEAIANSVLWSKQAGLLK